MPDTRRKDVSWEINHNEQGRPTTTDAQLAVLMDIRDELKKLNNLLHCKNFIEIPQILREILANTGRRKYTKSKK